jgi:hypothetical protein
MGERPPVSEPVNAALRVIPRLAQDAEGSPKRFAAFPNHMTFSDRFALP